MVRPGDHKIGASGPRAVPGEAESVPVSAAGSRPRFSTKAFLHKYNSTLLAGKTQNHGRRMEQLSLFGIEQV